MSRPTLDMPIDYVDFLRACVEAEVEFVVVGGWAVAVHGYGRSTDDLDVFVRADAANAARLVSALEDFGAPLKQHGVDASLFAQEGMAYRMGRKPTPTGWSRSAGCDATHTHTLRRRLGRR